MKKTTVISACLVSFLLAGCAEKSQNIQPSYASPIAYDGLSCRQMRTEAQRVSTRASTLAGVQDKNASNDAVATGVALVLFWPAAFFIKGNKENAAELSRLKGELQALEQSSNAKNCGIVFEKPKPAAKEETKTTEET